MATACLKCGGAAESRFRPVMGQGRMERLCEPCAGELSDLVQAAGDTCVLSLSDPRLTRWLETGRWPGHDGREIGPEDLPRDWHGGECPCCATFGEGDE